MADGKPGAPKGNQNARQDNRMITNALRRAAAQNPDKLREACERVVFDAAEGNLAAFNVLADRLDGKAAQVVEHEIISEEGVNDLELARRIAFLLTKKFHPHCI
jgi:hypothetical protein